MNELTSIIINCVSTLVSNISTKYNIPQNDLINDILLTFESKNNQAAVTVIKTTVKEMDSNKQYCQHIYTKGSKSGSSCTNVVSSFSNLCGRHKEKKTQPQPQPLNEKQKIILKLNKLLNLWWEPKSKLVVKSSIEKNVCIGIFKNDKLEKLSQNDIEMCKQLGFKFENFHDETYDDEDIKETDEENDSNKRRKLSNDDFMVINKTAKNVEDIINDMFGLN